MFLTRRNTFGPLHQFHREQSVCGLDSFRTTGKGFRAEYQLLPCGFASAPSVNYGGENVVGLDPGLSMA